MPVSLFATLLVAALASLFMAWVIGAGSSGATPFAPAVGANAISVMRAGFFVGILGFVGAVTQGANVSEAVGEGLVAGVSLTPLAAIVGLSTGAAMMAIGLYTGYPIATAFTVTGAIIGAGLAMGGDPAWAKYRQIAAMWVFTPFVGGGVAYAIARVLPREDVPERLSVPLLGGLVGVVVANVRFVALGPGDTGQSLARTAASGLPGPLLAGSVVVSLALGLAVAGVVRYDVVRSGEAALRRFLVGLGSLVAFSAGGSQVGLAIGPLLPLLGEFEVSLTAVLVGGGLGMLAGSWTGAPRMIKAIAQDYASLGPRRSIAALIPSFAIAQTAVLLGVPISFNEIIVSAILGSGLAVGGAAGISRAKMVNTVLAWIGSFVVAFAVGFGVVSLLG